MKSIFQILEEYWGFKEFRPLQEDIIQNVLNGMDTVALLPTGGGKSLCYQVPPLVNEGICIVISPLVALMEDQVKDLREKGIRALHLAGGLKTDEVVTLLDNARFGNYSFLYLSPERLQQEIVQSAIRKMDISLIAVDEAHCISQWGNDFRPSYKQITVLRELHPLVPILALTATATPEVLEDTVAELKMESPGIFRKSFFRENLSYEVYKTEDKLNRIKHMLRDGNSAIIYVRSRKMTVETSSHLNAMGMLATFYHGGLTAGEKSDRLAEWKAGKVPIMVATNAFGMGIDKANVRDVIHIQLPESLESYYQEAGRAGRDGSPSTATVLYSEQDIQIARKQFIEALPTKKSLKKLYKRISNYFQVPYGEGSHTDHPFNFAEFCSAYKLNSAKAYSGLNMLDRLGILRMSKQFGRRSTMRFTGDSDKLLAYFEGKPEASLIGKTILRVYGGIFELMTPVNLELISNKTGQAVDFITEVLKSFERDGMAEIQLFDTDAVLTFLIPREDDKAINRLAGDLKEWNRRKEFQVNAVIDYVTNDQECRNRQLLDYFGEPEAEECGICSVCKTGPDLDNGKLKSLAKQIEDALKDGPLTSAELMRLVKVEEDHLIKGIKELLDISRIGIDKTNRYYNKV